MAASTMVECKQLRSRICPVKRCIAGVKKNKNILRRSDMTVSDFHLLYSEILSNGMVNAPVS